MAIRILIVDDHAVVRQGLKMFLALEAGFEIVGEAANGADAVQLARQLAPHVVLMDLIMPVMDGIRATQLIRRELPATEVIALTSVLENDLVVEAIKAGAISFLIKDTQAGELTRAIYGAAAGKVLLSPQAKARLVREIHFEEKIEKLTGQETEVLRQIARGRADRETAAALHLSEDAVQNCVSDILKKLDVSSRTQAVLFAIRAGLISFDET